MHILFPTGTLGDLLGWFHYAERFRQLHQCQLECVMGQEINDLLAPQYPDITFSTNASVQTENPYASFRPGQIPSFVYSLPDAFFFQ